LDEDTQNDLEAISAAYAVANAPWQRVRVSVVEQFLRNDLSADQIAVMHGVSRRSLFNYWSRFCGGGVAQLLARGRSTGRPRVLQGVRFAEFEAKVRRGSFDGTAAAQEWIFRRTGKHLTKRGVLKLLTKTRDKLSMESK